MGDFIRSLSVDEIVTFIMVLYTTIIITGAVIEVRKAGRGRWK